MNFGGPVWHASISAPGRVMIPARLFTVADHVLRGVGDATLGEWREIGDIAVHLRRRVTAAEMRAAGIDAVCDIRGTEECTRRIRRLRPHLPPAMRDLPDAAFA